MLLAFDPDSFSQLQRCVHDETPSPSLKNILALETTYQQTRDVYEERRRAMEDLLSSMKDSSTQADVK